MAARALILFAVERAKNAEETHRGFFSNFEPEVPQKIFWNPEKIDFCSKNFFREFFWGTSGRKFEKSHRDKVPNFLLFQVQKELERYLQYPWRKKIVTEIGRVKKTTYEILVN